MTPQIFAEQLVALPDIDAQKRLLADHVSLITDSVVDALKAQADKFLRVEVHRSIELAKLLAYIAELTASDHYRALALITEANAFSIGGLGEYQRAIDLYDAAAAIYRACSQEVGEARSQIGKIFALAHLERAQEAELVGTQIAQVFEAHHEWLMLGKVYSNLGVNVGRKGKDEEALAYFERARQSYEQLGEEGRLPLSHADFNRSIHLRNLGRFAESLQLFEMVENSLAEAGHTITALRARQNRATTYFMLGRYNEALALLYEVREGLLADGRRRDAVLVELFISDCLLQMRRFQDVLNKGQQIRQEFTEIGLGFEVALTILNEAVALAGLGQYTNALKTLETAHTYFVKNDYPVWASYTEMEKAFVLQYETRFEESFAIAHRCVQAFTDLNLPVRTAQAALIAGRAAIARKEFELAYQLAAQVMAVGDSNDLPEITYACRHLLGNLAHLQGNLADALAEYDLAIQVLERLRGQLMVEFRIDFLEDKQEIYAQAVDLCLQLDMPERGLLYAERAKSRTLVDLLAHRIDISIQSRRPDDYPLINELTRLRAARDQLCRGWESKEELHLRGQNDLAAARVQVQSEVLKMEQKITELWHTLLVRNADYTKDASLWQVRTEPIQPYLAYGTLLLEFFLVQGQFVVFLCTHDSIEAIRLGVQTSQIQRLLQLFRLNLSMVPVAEPHQMLDLTKKSQAILQKLYKLLVAPLADRIAAHTRLVIVPHELLHYLPFHALFDGQAYLLETHDISYLPSASFLHYCREPHLANQKIAAFGYSFDGRLPFTLEEAHHVARSTNGEVYLESQVTKAQLAEAAASCSILHLATHGEFRSDNPLFSGLLLADGWLTTLDIFNLHLHASLVTLSACQTGKNVIGAGDELLGLMRAFVFAGASSLLVSHWPVEDRSTAQFMTAFYNYLVSGLNKSSALRQAQCQFLYDDRSKRSEPTERHEEIYAHPYYWAPFFLIGNVSR